MAAARRARSARLLASFDAWVPALIELGQDPSGLEKLAVLIEYIFRVVDEVTGDILHAKIRALGASAEELTMTFAEVLQAKGHAVAKGRLDALRRLLALKFRRPGRSLEARLQAALTDAVDRCLERLLTADSLAAVLAD